MTAIEKVKLWSAAILIIASIYIAGYELGSDRTAARLGVLLVGFLLATLLVAFSVPGREFFEFSKAAQIELRKIIWPSREETLRMTAVVVLLVALIMMFLWVVDFVLAGMLDVLAV
ncbi:MAG: preprotein translocase subunit SecE [Gammaproteobacteria bacterium WSBS_2016_MAG_OTU1]